MNKLDINFTELNPVDIGVQDISQMEGKFEFSTETNEITKLTLLNKSEIEPKQDNKLTPKKRYTFDTHHLLRAGETCYIYNEDNNFKSFVFPQGIPFRFMIIKNNTVPLIFQTVYSTTGEMFYSDLLPFMNMSICGLATFKLTLPVAGKYHFNLINYSLTETEITGIKIELII